MPDDLPTIMEQSRRKVADLLARFCDTPGNRNQGGFVNPATGWADSRNSIYEVNDLFAAYLYPEFRRNITAVRPLLEKLRMHLDFMRRRQYPDGSIALGMRAASAAATRSVLPSIGSQRDLPAGREVRSAGPGRDPRPAGRIHAARRGGDPPVFPVHEQSSLDGLHRRRWRRSTGFFPDPGNAEVIEEYLSDGIDIDADGLYYEERSPNYNHVANYGLICLADYWGRRDLLKLVEKNLRLALAMRQPSDEAETLFSHRQDRGGRGRTWGSYAIFKRMAIETGDGTLATAADLHLDRATELPLARFRLRYFVR